MNDLAEMKKKIRGMGFDADLAANLIEIVQLSVKAGREEALEAACEILNRRANGYAARGNVLFNGRIMADELQGNIREIRQLANTQG